MLKLIKNGEIVNNEWQWLEKPESASEVSIPTGKVVVPLSVWKAQRDTLQQRTDIGVWLESDEMAADLGDDCKGLPLVAVHFPLFMDGRGFSTARLLRERFDFTGELRATGYFLRDQLCYLKRCGVNAFEFTHNEINLEDALSSLNDFTEYYQSSVDQPKPLFRRRHH